MQYVSGNKILDSKTGQEVMWRGCGGAYTLNGATPADTLAGWTNIFLPLIKHIGCFNTIRLAFGFSWDGYYTTLNYDEATMDAVIDLLAANGLKSILDYHSYSIPLGLSDSRFAPAWAAIASHYVNNENVVAYEIYNEPPLALQPGTTAQKQRANAQGYHDITQAIRSVDPDHICIWEGPTNYIPDFSLISDLMLPNIVYTRHWQSYATTLGGVPVDPDPAVAAQNVMNYHLLSLRSQYNLPWWFGEASTKNTLFTLTDDSWARCQAVLCACELNDLPWNLWMGSTTPSKAAELTAWQPMFPLPVKKWLFRHWQDGDTNTTKTITV